VRLPDKAVRRPSAKEDFFSSDTKNRRLLRRGIASSLVAEGQKKEGTDHSLLVRAEPLSCLAKKPLSLKRSPKQKEGKKCSLFGKASPSRRDLSEPTKKASRKKGLNFFPQRREELETFNYIISTEGNGKTDRDLKPNSWRGEEERGLRVSRRERD